MFDLPYLAARVFGTPLLVARGKLDVILGVLSPRLTGGGLVPRDSAVEPTEPVALQTGAIAVVSVVGTMVARSSYLDAESGLLSYCAVGDTIESALDDPAVRGVILDIDSCGGEVGGLFDLVGRIAALKANTGKPVWAIANEDALSAAYAIASAADRIYVTQTGEVGSIGVVAAHVDESVADARAGLSWSFVFAGDQKVDGNAHEPLSQRARATIQADVDRLYGEFCKLVSVNRSLPIDAVVGTQAATFRGALAVSAGLADRVGTLDQAINEMTAELDAPDAPQIAPAQPIPTRSPSMSNETTQVAAVADPAAVPASAAPGQAAQSDPSAVPTAAPAAAPAPPPPAPALVTATAPAMADPSATLRAEYAEIASLAAQASRLGVTIDAADAMRKGVSVDALRRTILDTLASRSEAATVIAAAPTAPAANESPLVRRARERAAAARG
jgi:signal peptide peptidase SppA